MKEKYFIQKNENLRIPDLFGLTICSQTDIWLQLAYFIAWRSQDNTLHTIHTVGEPLPRSRQPAYILNRVASG